MGIKKVLFLSGSISATIMPKMFEMQVINQLISLLISLVLIIIIINITCSFEKMTFRLHMLKLGHLDLVMIWRRSRALEILNQNTAKNILLKKENFELGFFMKILKPFKNIMMVIIAGPWV